LGGQFRIAERGHEPPPQVISYLGHPVLSPPRVLTAAALITASAAAASDPVASGAQAWLKLRHFVRPLLCLFLIGIRRYS
jgi:hypothetical protein